MSASSCEALAKMQQITSKQWPLFPFFVQGLMADKNELSFEEEEYENNPGYTPPAPKSLKDIQEQDKDDESLLKYKQTLLGAPLGAEGAYAPSSGGRGAGQSISASTHSFLPRPACLSSKRLVAARANIAFGVAFIPPSGPEPVQPHSY